MLILITFIQKFYLLTLKYCDIKQYIWPKTHETLKSVIQLLIEQIIFTILAIW
jgi:hypothetical protein